MRPKLSQTILAAFCAILCATSLGGGGMMLGLSRVAMAGGGGGVEFCDYITNDGSAYIETDYYPQETQRWVLEAAMSNFYNAAFFGCSDTGGSESTYITKVINMAYCGWGMAYNDRRFLIRIRPDGTDWCQWAPAYSGNDYFDGDIHRFSTKIVGIRSMFELTIDDEYQITSGWGGQYYGTTNTVAETPVGIFCRLRADRTAAAITPVSVGFKFARLRFYGTNDETDLLADFRAAIKDGEYGVYNTVTKNFIGGTGGTITGV